MLAELVSDFIDKKSVVVTSSAGNGATSFCLYAANILLREDRTIVYFNPQDSIEKSFVQKFYPRVYDNVIFAACTISDLLVFLEYMEYKIDHLILDPADCLMYNSKVIPSLVDLIDGKIICTSQIRQDPSKGGQIYSTIENKYMASGIFDYSIWIRNVTESNAMMKRKYVDVFDTKRSGNNYIFRYIANFTDEGNIVT